MAENLTSFPARLHVLVAREADTAVVIRRGPSKNVCTFLWDRVTDHVQIGQWLKGRIYERRADLSPDGRHLIYFAMNGQWNRETRGSWTTVSRAPYLKALDLYVKGDCWLGGGLFLSDERYWLNHACVPKDDILLKDSPVRRAKDYWPQDHFGAECTGVYYVRLIRDGWTLTERSPSIPLQSWTRFEKPLAGDWRLRKLCHEEIGAPVGKGCYWDEHELVNAVTGAHVPCPDWEWAEVDRDALIWATHGQLFRAKLDGSTGIQGAALVHDFNPYRFEEIRAPYDEGWRP